MLLSHLVVVVLGCLPCAFDASPLSHPTLNRGADLQPHRLLSLAGSSSSSEAWHRWWDGGVSTGPRPRQAHSATACGGSSMVVFGGFGGLSSDDFLHDLWKFDTLEHTWSQLQPETTSPKPSPRASHSSVSYVLDVGGVPTCTIILFGGASENASEKLADMSDLWFLTLPLTPPLAARNGVLPVWTKVSPAGGVMPAARNEQVSVVRHRNIFPRSAGAGSEDEVGWEMYIFGGVSGEVDSLKAHGDVWRFDVASQTWTALEGRGVGGRGVPAARFSHAGCLVTTGFSLTNFRSDTAYLRGTDGKDLPDTDAPLINEDMLVVFGGRNAGTAGSYSMFSDLWYFGLDSHTWREQQIDKTQLTRSYHSMVFYNSMLIIFGGYQRVVDERQEHPLVYVYNKALTLQPNLHHSVTWNEFGVASNVQPSVRFAHSAVMFGGNMVVYAGRFQKMRNDMYALNVSDMYGWRLPIDNEGQLFDTMHFLVAILSMMILCICVFVFSLRRRFRAQHRLVILGGLAPQLGVQESVIQSFPIQPFVAAPAAPSNPDDDPNDDMCPICLLDYEDGEDLRLLPCTHRYHPPCVDEWLKLNKVCPMCKHDVTGPAPSRCSASTTKASTASTEMGPDGAGGGAEEPEESEEAKERAASVAMAVNTSPGIELQVPDEEAESKTATSSSA